MSRPHRALDLLAFAPHPDDAELFAGGLIAISARRGHRVGIIDLTRGERATRGDPDTRALEAQEAARILGLCHRENLGLPDAALAATTGALGELDDVDSPILRVVNVIRRLRPTVVIAPPRIERHPDHEHAGALVRRALFLAGLVKVVDVDALPPFTPRQTLVMPMRVELPVSFVVDITDAIEVKREAILAHRSQVGSPEADGPLIGSALALAAIEARDRYHGVMIGAAAGEPYFIESAFAIPDPVAFFRDLATGPAHLFPRRH